MWIRPPLPSFFQLKIWITWAAEVFARSTSIALWHEASETGGKVVFCDSGRGSCTATLLACGTSPSLKARAVSCSAVSGGLEVLEGVAVVGDAVGRFPASAEQPEMASTPPANTIGADIHRFASTAMCTPWIIRQRQADANRSDRRVTEQDLPSNGHCPPLVAGGGEVDMRCRLGALTGIFYGLVATRPTSDWGSECHRVSRAGTGRRGRYDAAVRASGS